MQSSGMRLFQYSESSNVRKHALGPVVALLPVLCQPELFELEDFKKRLLELLAKGHGSSKHGISVAAKVEAFNALARWRYAGVGVGYVCLVGAVQPCSF